MSLESVRRFALVLALVGVAALALAVGIFLGQGVFAPGPAEPPAEPVAVTAESNLIEDRIVHSFAPQTDEHQTYRVTYEVYEAGTTIESVENQSVELSATNPLLIQIEDRIPDVEYLVRIAIWDAHDRLVYRGEIRVGPQVE